MISIREIPKTGQAFKQFLLPSNDWINISEALGARTPPAPVKQSTYDGRPGQRTWHLHLHPLLPVEVHLLQLCLGSLSSQRSCPLCRSPDSGSGGDKTMGLRSWRRTAAPCGHRLSGRRNSQPVGPGTAGSYV